MANPIDDIQLEEVLSKSLREITPEERMHIVNYYRDLRERFLKADQEKAEKRRVKRTVQEEKRLVDKALDETF